MLVSIVIPIYNAERYIEKCVTSLFEQTYKDIEYIFVDDASNDRSLSRLEAIINRYEERRDFVRILHHKKNRGSAMARCTGLLQAKGDYLIQVDSDDYVAPEYIERLATKVQEDDSDVAICDFNYIYGNGKVKKAGIGPMCQNRDECLCHLLSGKLHNGLWNKLVRRSLFSDYKITFVKGVDMFDDKSVMYKILFFAKKISYIDEQLYFYNKTNPNSISSQSKILAIKPAIKLNDMMDDFFAVNDMAKEDTKAITLGLNYYKISIMGLILLYDNERMIERNMSHFVDRKWRKRDIMRQPTIPYYYKLAVMCYHGHFYVGVRILRGLLRTFKSFK